MLQANLSKGLFTEDKLPLRLRPFDRFDAAHFAFEHARNATDLLQGQMR